jgi:signal transduction histidine kinase
MKLRAGVPRLRPAQTTVRWRLTLLYGGLFLVCGAALLAITYTLVAHATQRPANAVFVERSVGPVGRATSSPFPTQIRLPPGVAVPPDVKRLVSSRAGKIVVGAAVRGQRISDLHQLELWSAIALALMVVISTALGWVVAGRVLAPLRTITATTQQISEANLHQRLAMQGPRDELHKLADTIDGLLERLERAFEAQRRFVANASHELRTPLTSARALLELAISDPDATLETFRETCRQALEDSDHQERLIDALLALAQGQRGIERREPIDLAALTGDVLQAHEPDVAARGLALDASLGPAMISGDRRLIERLVSNLLENAIRHNLVGGRVQVRVEARVGTAAVAISNTGPPVPADDVQRLLQPFQRLAPDRTETGGGLGLGLSIVAAIANAHDAVLDIQPHEHGGLSVEARFPLAGASAPLVAEERLDVRGEPCGVLEQEAVRSIRVDLQPGLRDQPREQV